MTTTPNILFMNWAYSPSLNICYRGNMLLQCLVSLVGSPLRWGSVRRDLNQQWSRQPGTGLTNSLWSCTSFLSTLWSCTSFLSTLWSCTSFSSTLWSCTSFLSTLWSSTSFLSKLWSCTSFSSMLCSCTSFLSLLSVHVFIFWSGPLWRTPGRGASHWGPAGREWWHPGVAGHLCCAGHCPPGREHLFVPVWHAALPAEAEKHTHTHTHTKA